MKAEVVVTVVKKLLEHADPAKNTATEKTQYNIRVDGAVEKSFVFNMKDLEVNDGPVDDADVDITIDDEDFASLFKGQSQLVELFAEKKIEVSGDESLLKTLDDARAAVAAKLKELKDAE